MTDLASTAYPILAYGADPTGKIDCTGVLQAVFTDAVTKGTKVVDLPSGATFLWSEPITLTGDVTVNARGCTLKWNGPAGQAGFVNSVPINLAWYGGTIDGNNIASTQSLFALGAGPGVSPASSYLLSCVAEDIEFINVTNGAWTANAIDSSGANMNTYLTWRNLRCTKSASGTAGDMFEVVGQYVNVEVTGDENGTGAAVLTSAWLADAHTRSTANYDKPNLVLQPYTGNGPAPFFVRTVCEADSGRVLLNNGDLTALEEVSDTLRIICTGVNLLQVGNSDFDAWGNTQLAGDLHLTPTSSLEFGQAHGIEADLVLDCSSIPGTQGQAGIVQFFTASANNFVRFKRLLVRNLVAGAATAILATSTPNATAELTIDSGDITENVGVPLFAATSDYNQFGTCTVRNVEGFNPQGFGTGTLNPAMPASGTAQGNPNPFPCLVNVEGGTVTDIAVDGISTGLTSGTFLVQASTGTITLTYTAAPTWKWQGI